MDWLMILPIAYSIGCAFVLGLVVGSFLNVLIVRLPFEKSVLWPGSRCMTCLRSLPLQDNLPIIGYLRRRGRCRFCNTQFSSAYLWVELFTGIAFAGLFYGEIMSNWHESPGLVFGVGAIPPFEAFVHFLAHASLLALLIATSMTDIKYRVVPLQLTYFGTLLGLLFSTLFPWPFPNLPTMVPTLPGVDSWIMPQFAGRVPIGTALWPFWGPPPSWAPPGSHQLGLMTGLIGAIAGQFVVRGIKFLFEMGFGRDALGLGDGDLLMMAGAFLGWQPVVLALFVGACLMLAVIIPKMMIMGIWRLFRPKPPTSTVTMEGVPEVGLPFVPGLAAGVVATWIFWPLFGELVRTIFFDYVLLGFVIFVVGGGLLVCGTLLSIMRGAAPMEETKS